MKQILFFLSLTLLLCSCEKPERGNPDFVPQADYTHFDFAARSLSTAQALMIKLIPDFNTVLASQILTCPVDSFDNSGGITFYQLDYTPGCTVNGDDYNGIATAVVNGTFNAPGSTVTVSTSSDFQINDIIIPDFSATFQYIVGYSDSLNYYIVNSANVVIEDAITGDTATIALYNDPACDNGIIYNDVGDDDTAPWSPNFNDIINLIVCAEVTTDQGVFIGMPASQVQIDYSTCGDYCPYCGIIQITDDKGVSCSLYFGDVAQTCDASTCGGDMFLITPGGTITPYTCPF